jgi:hypothetical protein
VCLKFGHTANRCWHRFDEDYVPEPRSAATTFGPRADNAWYTDSGATVHITGELDRLTMHEPYTGLDQVHTANGSGLDITQVGSIIPSSNCDLVLNNDLYVPSTPKNLISVHHFTLDNDTFTEFHSFFLLRTAKQRRCCCMCRVRAASIPFHHLHPSFGSLCFMPSKSLMIGGIVA